MAKITRKRRREIRNDVRFMAHRMLSQCRPAGFQAGAETEYAVAYMAGLAKAFEASPPTLENEEDE